MTAKKHPSKSASLPIHVICESQYPAWKKKQSTQLQNWLKDTNFHAKAGNSRWLVSDKGAFSGALAIVNDAPDCWSIADLPIKLPPLRFHLETTLDNTTQTQLVLGWELGTYQFSKYKKHEPVFAELVMPKGVDKNYICSAVDSICWARDMINTPANDMHPAALADEAVCWGQGNKAKVKLLKGDQLIKENYPMIYTVGKASAIAPHLVDLRFARKGAPKVTLVGKGVTFDSGGLDIKPSSNMRLMKKDMGGAACVLALAKMILDAKLPVQLRVLLPIVENAINGNAMRPSDVAPTRSGLSVEIGNTDAEGRLILCDALTEADSEKPDLLIDCATLTGAARVALGTDVPVYFSNNPEIAERIHVLSAQENDPMWRLPLWEGYRSKLDSPIAELSNDPQSSYGGAIAAALFLQEFVPHSKAWVHVDMMAWNMKPMPGRPLGGEAMAVRALFALIKDCYGTGKR